MNSLSDFKQLYSVGSLFAKSSNNLRQLAHIAMQMHQEDQNESGVSGDKVNAHNGDNESLFSNDNRNIVKPIVKLVHSTLKYGKSVPFSATLVQQQLGTIRNLSVQLKSMSQPEEPGDSSSMPKILQDATVSAMGCLSRRIARHVAKNGKKELEQLAQDFEHIMQSFLDNMIPVSLFDKIAQISHHLIPGSSGGGDDNDDSNGTVLFNMDTMLCQVQRLVMEFPKRVIEQELDEVDRLATELLSREKLRQLVAEQKSSEERKEIIRKEVNTLLQRVKSLRKSFESLVTQDFISKTLQPLEVIMQVTYQLMAELCKSVNNLPVLRESMHDLVKLLLSIDDRLLRVFRPPGLIMCLCACFLTIPDELQKLQHEIKLFKDSTLTKWLMSCVDILTSFASNGSDNEIRRVMLLTQKQHKQFIEMRKVIEVQIASFEELDSISNEIEERILRVVDQLMESAVGRAVDSVLHFKDRVVGFFYD